MIFHSQAVQVEEVRCIGKMIKKINYILNNNNGNGLISLLWLMMIIFLLSSIAYEYMRLNIISSEVKETLQNAVITVATQNYDNTQYTLQDGYVGAYSNEGVLQLDKGDIMDQMSGLTSMVELSNLEVNINQSKYNPSTFGDESGKYIIDSSIQITVPLNFGWDLLPPIKMTLKTSSGWGSKY